MKTPGYVCSLLLALMISACGGTQHISLENYYAYDHDLPLKDSVNLLVDSADFQLSYISFRSVHDKRVTGLLSLPAQVKEPLPVIILMHGLGDEKTVDYIESGHQYLLQAGYAVLRLDIDLHGDRAGDEYDFSFTEGYRYWTRSIITQTVFDLRRAIDFLETQPEIDATRIGYYGISLGGIIGTIFCGIDDRVKVPVITLAGGGLHLMFGTSALSEETTEYLSLIDPINYVEKITPRPLLMINAEQDEVVPPMMSKLLFRTAAEPKKIIWYPAKHRTVSPEKVYQDGIDWYDQHL